MKKIAIIGGGLAGSLLSVYLAGRGFRVDVYERRPDMRKDSSEGGRSINLALSARGIYALKEVGLYEHIKKIAIPMFGRMIHSTGGTTQLQPYGKDNTEYINAVSRSELNKALMDLAEADPRVRFHFSHRCTGIDFNTGELSFTDQSEKKIKLNADTVIAADGSASAVRSEMQRLHGFVITEERENYGYKELTVPPGPNGEFLMEKNALHIWPRGSFMLIALPNLDGSFTCTLFLANDRSLGGENSFESIGTEEKLLKFFSTNFQDALELMPELTREFFSHPTGSLITVKCYPWVVEGKCALLGDSCHAMVPFFGQGMNAAFEDCTYLNGLIEKHGNDWEKVFGEYQKLRKPNTDAISDLAKENFIEMRDLVALPRFQLKKKIEAELQKRFPGEFIPKYSMVTFHRIPYEVALKRGRVQEKMLDELSFGVNDIKDIDWVKAKDFVESRLKEIKDLS